MGQITCRECQTEVSLDTAVCPSCGCLQPALPSPVSKEAGAAPLPEESSFRDLPPLPEAKPRPPVSPVYTFPPALLYLLGIAVWLLALWLGWSHRGAYGMGEAVGTVLPVALILLLIRTKVRWMQRWPGFTFLLIMVISLGVMGIRVQRFEVKRQKAAAAIREARKARTPEEMMNATIKGLRKSDDPTAPELAKFFQTMMKEQQAIGEAYNKELEAADLETLLAPEAFASKAASEKATVRIQQLKAVTLQYQQDTYAYWDSVRGRLDKLAISQKLKESFRQGFNSTNTSARAALREYIQIELNLFDAFLELHALARQEFGHYIANEDVLEFSRPKAKEQSLSLYLRISSLIDEEAKAAKKMQSVFEENSQRHLSELEANPMGGGE